MDKAKVMHMLRLTLGLLIYAQGDWAAKCEWDAQAHPHLVFCVGSQLRVVFYCGVRFISRNIPLKLSLS